MTDAAIPPALSGFFVSTENNEHLVLTEEWFISKVGLEQDCPPISLL